VVGLKGWVQSVCPGSLYSVVLEVGCRLPGCGAVCKTDRYLWFVISLSVGWWCPGAGSRPLLLLLVVRPGRQPLDLVVA